MAISFPLTPTIGQVYSFGNKSWTWDGTGWAVNTLISLTTATNLNGGAAGSVPYQSAANTTALLPVGSDGQVLTVASGIPAWSTPAAGGGSSGFEQTFLMMGA